jgi:putative flippase GtrA
MTATMTNERNDLFVVAEPPVLDVVVPVYNEQIDLAPSIRRLHRYLVESFPFSFRITIADNASTDDTPRVAARLERQLPGVAFIRLDEKGRGRALSAAWSTSDAQVLAYMDVDLATDLAALLPLVAPLVSGHSDLAIGTRLARGSHVTRGAKREMISRCYNLILRGTLAARFSDAQCGFKAIRSDVAAKLLPLVKDTGWFFDTEMLVLAQRSGLRIHEVPVDWVDDRDSRVHIVPTAIEDLKGVGRLLRGFTTGSIPLTDIRRQFGRDVTTPNDGRLSFSGQVARFIAIGLASTAAYALLFLVMQGSFGSQRANLIALLLTALANTAANRRVTFGVHGREGAVRQHVQGLIVFTLGLALTAGALAALHAYWPNSPTWIELTVLVIANLVTTLARFLALRLWVFPQRRVASEIGAG